MIKSLGFAAAVCGALISSPSYASVSDLCNVVRDYADTAMRSRQAGVEYSELSNRIEIEMREYEDFKSLLISILGGAYLEDRQATKAAQQAAINAYSRAWYHACVFFHTK